MRDPTGMNDVKVTFRGMNPQEALITSAQRWTQAIRDGLPPSSTVEADVLIQRSSPEWGGSTTVRVTLHVNGKESAASARSEEPHDAVDASFATLGRRLCRRLVASDVVPAVATRIGSLREGLWGPAGTF